MLGGRQVSFMGSMRLGIAFRLVPERQGAEEDGQHAAGDHRREHAVPAPVIGDPAHAEFRGRNTYFLLRFWPGGWPRYFFGLPLALRGRPTFLARRHRPVSFSMRAMNASSPAARPVRVLTRIVWTMAASSPARSHSAQFATLPRDSRKKVSGTFFAYPRKNGAFSHFSEKGS